METPTSKAIRQQTGISEQELQAGLQRLTDFNERVAKREAGVVRTPPVLMPVVSESKLESKGVRTTNALANNSPVGQPLYNTTIWLAVDGIATEYYINLAEV